MLIKASNLGELTKQAVVLDLGDLRRQGELLMAQAREHAEAIRTEARAERDEMFVGASVDGRAMGMEKGLQEGRAQGLAEGQAAGLMERKEALDRIATAWVSELDVFSTRRERMLADARTDVLKLAAQIATKVVKRRVELSPEVVVDQMAAVLAMVIRPTRLVVRVSPQDRALVEEAMPDLTARFRSAQHVELVDDAALERGSVRAAVAEAGGGEIDAAISVQIERIVEALLPGPGGPGGAGVAA
ncbi:MAG: FliH/SctL family protein [Phycisphaerales bacterium]